MRKYRVQAKGDVLLRVYTQWSGKKDGAIMLQNTSLYQKYKLEIKLAMNFIFNLVIHL